MRLDKSLHASTDLSSLQSTYARPLLSIDEAIDRSTVGHMDKLIDRQSDRPYVSVIPSTMFCACEHVIDLPTVLRIYAEIHRRTLAKTYLRKDARTFDENYRRFSRPIDLSVNASCDAESVGSTHVVSLAMT